ncbi:hypothetical protein DKP76_06390 [Falsochrobactrum shanghaiense]|uniref:Uncharacterized protein n=1 Tax=Falsochrobactrum shanghaiense TaxID=2201899 RepID=A0A316JB72_9HYPH|nr:hypothetical protein DKP76_06390 [Falsochrobactrum shanghaiense]
MSPPLPLKHVARKWEPVSDNDMRKNNNLKRVPKSVKRFSEKMRVKTKTESVRSESERSRHALTAAPAFIGSVSCGMKSRFM